MPLKRKNSRISSQKPRASNGQFARIHISITGSQEDNKKEERDSTYSPSSESDGTSDTDSAYSDEIEVCEQAKEDIQKFHNFGSVCIYIILKL